MHTEKRDFNQEATAWDEHPARVRLASDIVEAIKGQGILRPEMEVLDFGCGTGLVSLGLQPLVGSLTGVDSSQGMLAVLKAKIDRLGLANVRTQYCDLDQGDRLAGRYDLVISSMTLHHVKEVGPLLASLHAVLTPGGSLCLADLDSEEGQFHDNPAGVFHSGFDRRLLLQALGAAGFVEGRAATAAAIEKPGRDGAIRCFTVFLMTARKP
jgi:2-polyprenyl-3-methyl-5-hydroxy-6-metoxy-1,4-benzoquinol methylase